MADLLQHVSRFLAARKAEEPAQPRYRGTSLLHELHQGQERLHQRVPLVVVFWGQPILCARAAPAPPPDRYRRPRDRAPSSDNLTQPAAEVLREGITEHFLQRAIGLLGMVILSTAGRQSERYPIRRTVSGAAEPPGIHECFEIVDRMPIDAFPVQRQPACHTGENVRPKMWNLHEGQNQETGVVGQEADVPPPRLGRPAYEPVTGSQMSRCR